MVPLGVDLISGSLPTFPNKMTLLTLFAITVHSPRIGVMEKDSRRQRRRVVLAPAGKPAIAKPLGDAERQQQAAEWDAHKRHNEREPTAVGARACRRKSAQHSQE